MLNPSPNRTLIMLHFAGGNRYSFQPLQKHLLSMPVVALELPGRGIRIREPLIYDIWDAARDMVSQFEQQNIQGEYVVYGHSMGAILGLLFTSILEKKEKPPTQLVVSGSPGPLDVLGKQTHLYPKGEFKDMLTSLGGIPEEVLNNEELFDFFEPVLRADFGLVEKETIQLEQPINAPIMAIMGKEESKIDKIENWKKFTSNTFQHETWPGNHFFIHEHAERLAHLLRRYCTQKVS